MNWPEYLFYQVMNYPVPHNRERFWYQKKSSTILHSSSFILNSWFSRDHEPPINWTFRKIIKDRLRLIQSIPFVEAVYLCNSRSFNALKPTSDIDLFFVITPWRMRTARFFSVLFTWFAGIKRQGNNSAKKFCLSFYVTSDHQNLESIRLGKDDMYLPYRIAHLVPIYTRKTKQPLIRDHNKRIQNDLPNHPLQQWIDLWLPISHKTTQIKKTLEWLLTGRGGNLLEGALKAIRKPLVIKKKQAKKDWELVIISETMLKFYKDRRPTLITKFKNSTIHKHTKLGISEDW